MSEAREPTDDDRAAHVFGEIRERLDRGERVDVEEVVRAHPDLADALRRQFGALRYVERAFAADAAAPRAEPQDRLVGRSLGRYRLESLLGVGGMGTVFCGVAEGRRVAVKVLHPHLVARRGFAERFVREAELGLRVRHENVVATLDAGVGHVDGRAVHYLVMELVEGRTLRALFEETGRLPEALCRHVGRETALALAAIHAKGAVHRDVKPDNVIVTPAQTVKLMDLGVARLRDEAVRLSQTGSFVGSALYAAPEQFGAASGRGGRASVDERADLYSLGLTLYEAATGVHPFAHDEFHVVLRRQIQDAPRPAGEVNPQLSPFFEQFLRRLLEKDRRARFASAADVLRVLTDGEDSEWWRGRAKSIREETRRPLRRIRIPRETALHGREAELANLRAAFDDARRGDGRVVLLEGEAGIGKSRLVDEFAAGLAHSGEDVDFLTGGYPPGGAATAAGAFSAAYRERFLGDGSEIRDALAETPLLLPAFSALLRGDAAPSDAEPLTKDSLQTAFVHVTRSLAAARPTIVVIDDLHFAPAEGRALFAALALAVPGHRVLLVGTARPGLEREWLAQLDRLGAMRVQLPRLGTKDLVRLLADSLRSTHVAEELAGKIGVKSDGNPFFVFEILRGLREGQFLTRREDGTWATTREIREIVVPSSVVELVQARVSDLSRADRNVLEVASCVGFEFDPALVGEVLRMERIPLLQTLGAIEKSHRLVRSVGRGFAFDHHQVVEVLYAGLSEPLREEYHAAIGAALEARSGATEKEPKALDGAVCVGIAEHLLAGRQGARALRYLPAALTHLERNYVNEAAVRLLERALAEPLQVAGSERAKALLRLAGRLELLGRRDAQRIAAQEALDLAHAAGDGSTEAAAARNLGTLAKFLGRFDESRELHERSLALALEHRDRWREATCCSDLGNLYWTFGRYAESRAWHERSLAIAREIADLRSESAALGNLAGLESATGRFAEALSLYEQGLDLARRSGSRVGEARALGNIGVVLWLLGDFGDALTRLGSALELSRQTGDRRVEARTLVNLGPLLATLGAPEDGRGLLVRSLELCRDVGERRVEGFALHRLGRLAARAGDVDEGERHLREALELRRGLGNAAATAETLVALGAVCAARGATDEARRCWVEAHDAARDADAVEPQVLAASRLAAHGGDASAAAALFAAHESRVPYEERMEARLLLWSATRDAAHLAAAKRLLDDLVAHAPPERREAMLANVPLHREILAAGLGR